MLNNKLKLKTFKIIFILLFSFSTVFLTLGAVVDSVRNVDNLNSSELKDLMDQKSAALQEFSVKRRELENNLNLLGSKSLNLKRELKKIDYQINQINLNIQSGEVNLEKLDLEIELINLGIQDIEKGVKNAKNTIAAVIQNLQQEEGDNFLISLLRYASLSASVSEAKMLADFNGALAAQIIQLKNLRLDLTLKIGDVSRKRIKKEIETNRLKDQRLIVIDQKDDRQEILIQTKNQEKIYQQKLSELEKKQVEIAAEVDLIETELRAKLDPSLLPLPRPGVLSLPIEGEKRITQKFGQVSRFYGGKPHNGLDLRAIIGTPILAAGKGKIIMVADQDKFCRRGAYGKVVLIEHENNLTTLYAHLSRYVVTENDLINEGDLIGYAGKTGYATGPHLHFGVYVSQTVSIRPSRNCGLMPFGAPLNPADYL